jgi:hypothetical protein
MSGGIDPLQNVEGSARTIPWQVRQVYSTQASDAPVPLIPNHPGAG